MRTFRDFEVQDIFNFVNQPMVDIDTELNTDQVEIINKNLRKNIMFYLSNFVIFMPTKNPESVYLNIRLGEKPIHELANGKDISNFFFSFGKLFFLDFMNIFSPPCEVYFDFFCIATSDTRDDDCLIHPSVPTHFNQKTIYYDVDDVEEISKEFLTEGLQEKILERHHLVRTADAPISLITSNVKIDKIVCMWAFLNPL